MSAWKTYSSLIQSLLLVSVSTDHASSNINEIKRGQD